MRRSRWSDLGAMRMLSRLVVLDEEISLARDSYRLAVSAYSLQGEPCQIANKGKVSLLKVGSVKRDLQANFPITKSDTLNRRTLQTIVPLSILFSSCFCLT